MKSYTVQRGTGQRGNVMRFPRLYKEDWYISQPYVPFQLVPRFWRSFYIKLRVDFSQKGFSLPVRFFLTKCRQLISTSTSQTLAFTSHCTSTSTSHQLYSSSPTHCLYHPTTTSPSLEFLLCNVSPRSPNPLSSSFATATDARLSWAATQRRGAGR